MALHWLIVATACLPFVAGCGNAAPDADSSSVSATENLLLKSKFDTARKLAAVLDPQIIESTHRFVQQKVAAGFDTPEQIVALTIEQNANQVDTNELKLFIEKTVKYMLDEHLAAQQNWPAVTDCDRLDQAFHSLQSEGIFCSQNVRTNGSCGLILVKSEIEEQQKAGRIYDGYAIYYALDTDFATQGRGLNLSFDSTHEDEEPTAKSSLAMKIGQRIIAALEANGLHPQWDGTMKSRIFVPMDWKRRR